MPFEIGNKLSPGRPGYAIEQEQLERMRKILDRDMAMMEKYQEEEEPCENTKKKMALLQGRILKIYDKLHVTKTQTDITTKGESIIMPDKDLEALANKLNELARTKKDNERGSGRSDGTDTDTMDTKA